MLLVKPATVRRGFIMEEREHLTNAIESDTRQFFFFTLLSFDFWYTLYLEIMFSVFLCILGPLCCFIIMHIVYCI